MPVRIEQRKPADLVQRAEFVRRQGHVDGLQVVLELQEVSHADDDARDHIVREHPRERDLSDAGAVVPSHARQDVDDGEALFLVDRRGNRSAGVR